MGVLGLCWHTPKLPGLGDVKWGEFFAALTDAGYSGPVCIEVEDRAYEGSLADRQRALAERRFGQLRQLSAKVIDIDRAIRILPGSIDARRRLVAASVHAWYRATTGGGDARVARQSPSTLAHTFRQLAGSRPIYFIWARDPEGWQIIERGMREMECAGPEIGSVELDRSCGAFARELSRIRAARQPGAPSSACRVP